VGKIDYILVFIFIWLSGQVSMGQSQIVDDSTKQVYGPQSTNYVFEEDIINGSGKKFNPDTAIYDFHNYIKIYHEHEPYQDLGNLGTPASPIFYQSPAQIGKTLGYNGFNLYAYDPDKVKYFDTKSPYSSLSYYQGSRGQQILEGEFYRNVNSQWNVGFSMKTLSSKKIVGALSGSSTTDNRLASIFSFVFSTRYFTKNERYQILGNFTFFDGKNKESGGIRPDSLSEPQSGLFDYAQENANLYSARSLEKRFNFHIYQEFGITKSKALQLFHISDYRIVEHRFTDVRIGAGPFNDTLYLQNGRDTMDINYDNTSTNDKVTYNLLENKGGIKGKAESLSYMAYLRSKHFTYSCTHQIDISRQGFSKTFSENFVGGALRYAISDSSFINVNAEYFFMGKDDSTYAGSDYLFKAEYLSKYIFGGFYSVNSSPTLLQRRYMGNNLTWNNDFSPTSSNNAYAGARLGIGKLFLQGAAEYSVINDYIYYNEKARPQQDSSLISILSLKGLLKFSVSKFHLEEFFRFTTVSGDVIRVPEYYSQTRIYYQNKLFKKALLMQMGFDFYWKSEYFANNYMPVTQQYYLNTTFPVQSYVLGDFFIDAQIKRANVYVKVSHFNQLVQKGYFITPYYPGMPRTVELGIRWMFFD
jgi:hypothetical protein